MVERGTTFTYLVENRKNNFRINCNLRINEPKIECSKNYSQCSTKTWKYETELKNREIYYKSKSLLYREKVKLELGDI